VPLSQRRKRTLFADVGLFLGLLFWSVPVGALQVWTSIDELDEHSNSWWSESNFGVLCYTFLREYLPVLTLVGLQYVLPYVLDFLAREYEGHKVKSKIARRALKWNLKYQFVTIYVTVLSGAASLSFHNQLGSVIRNPERLFEILRDEVPQVACYFVNYVTAKIGITIPLLLFFPALPFWFSKVLGRSAREETPPVHPDFAMEAANLGVVLVLAQTYSVIAPSIMPMCMLFFILSYLVYCWLFTYVYTPEFDCFGRFWYELFNSLMWGLVLSSLSLAALASAFVGFDTVEFYALVILAGLVSASYIHFHKVYIVPSRHLSLEDACAVDRLCKDLVKEQFSEALYIDPIVTNPGAHLFGHREAGERNEQEVVADEVIVEEDTDFKESGAQIPGLRAGAQTRQVPLWPFGWICRMLLGCTPFRNRQGSSNFVGVSP